MQKESKKLGGSNKTTPLLFKNTTSQIEEFEET